MPNEQLDPDSVLADYKNRLADLLDAYWPDAVGGEHKSAELVRRILQQRASLFGITSQAVPVKPLERVEDELAELRAKRTTA